MTTGKNWCDDDSLWDAIGPFLFGDNAWEAVPDEVDQILKLLGLAPGGRVLDMCCGVGRHSIELACRGYQVTGVDRTARYLEQAEKKATADGLLVEFVREDMRRFCRPDQFDAAISMFTSFGYFDDPGEERRVVENIYRSLKTGGRLLIDLIGKEFIAAKFQARDWVEHNGAFMLEERTPVDSWTYLKNRWILVREGQTQEFGFMLRLYSGRELQDLLQGVGFNEVILYGDLHGDLYDQSAKRLIAVARK